MKPLLIISILLLAASLKAQTRKFNIEIQKDSSVKVYDGKDLIANYKVSPAIKSKIILTGYTQQKDPAGKYIAIYIFSSSDNLSPTNVHFVAKFNAAVFDAKYWSGATIGNPGEVLNEGKTEYDLTLNELQTKTFKLMVVGKEKIITTFSGIDGVAQ